MNIRNDLVPSPTVATTIALEDLRALARFSDPRSGALSFYLCSSDVTNNAHRSEAVILKDLIHDIYEEISQPIGGIDDDLQAILARGDHIRSEPNRLHAIFACFGQQLWQEFSLPVNAPRSSLRRGRHFSLAPLARALNALSPYAILVFESGKARLFMVHGTDIREIHDLIPVRDLSLHAQDSRVGWSHHIEGNQSEHEKAYFKDVVRATEQFLRDNAVASIVLGYREELWGDVAHLFYSIQEQVAFVGRFHLRDFAAGAIEILNLARPLVERAREQRTQDHKTFSRR